MFEGQGGSRLGDEGCGENWRTLDWQAPALSTGTCLHLTSDMTQPTEPVDCVGAHQQSANQQPANRVGACDMSAIDHRSKSLRGQANSSITYLAPVSSGHLAHPTPFDSGYILLNRLHTYSMRHSLDCRASQT